MNGAKAETICDLVNIATNKNTVRFAAGTENDPKTGLASLHYTAYFSGLVLGCIEYDFCKQIFPSQYCSRFYEICKLGEQVRYARLRLAEKPEDHRTAGITLEVQFTRT